MGKSEKNKMLTGELYGASDPELVHERQRCRSVLQAFNAQQDEDQRLALLKQLLGKIGTGAFIQPPFACDYGYNLSIGDNVFVNFNTVILDCASVMIGEGTQMALASSSSRPTIRETRRPAGASWSSLGPSRSDRTCGSARRPSCSRESRWGTTRSSGRAAWSRGTSRVGWWRWVPRAASCGRSEGSSVHGVARRLAGADPISRNPFRSLGASYWPPSAAASCRSDLPGRISRTPVGSCPG